MGGTRLWSYTCYRNFPHCCPHCPLFKEKKWLTLPFLAQRDGLRDALRDYCRDHFELELEQFDAGFIDFISEKLGPVYYNAGIEEAIRTHLAWSERIRKRWI